MATSMVGRKVVEIFHGIHGEIVKWEPLGSAMCDCLVRRENGSEVWVASHMLKPMDNLGPLPSRSEAQKEAKRKAEASLQAIADRWNK